MTNTTDSITTIEFLRKAREFIERGWTQGSSARDINGKGCVSFSPEATEWCAVGALNAVNAVVHDENFTFVRRAEHALDEAILAMFPLRADPSPARVTTILRYNDEPAREKRDILAVYDRAIEAES